MNGFAMVVTGVVAVMWLLAVTTKIQDRALVAEQVRVMLKLRRGTRAAVVALLVTEAVLVVAVALPHPAGQRAGLVGSASLLLLFSVVMVVSRSRSGEVSCGCFGMMSNGTNSVRHIVLTVFASIILLVSASFVTGPDIAAETTGVFLAMATAELAFVFVPIARRFIEGSR